MESYLGFNEEDEQIELPTGFRFHPTDEELITHYLSQKVLSSSFKAIAIGEVDLNRIEPWDLPSKAKMGEKEWYFFCVRDRKYPTGVRTNRATEAGYWKATGKDKEIYSAKSLIGMKKTLVFYTGRAPKGEKSNWIMHEYRLEGKYSKYNLPKTAKNEWVISRVFNKSEGNKKQNLQGFVGLEELQAPFLPPLTDSSPYMSETKRMIPDPSHVTCFFSPLMVEEQKLATTIQINHHNMINPSKVSNPNSMTGRPVEYIQYPDPVSMQDQSILRLLVEGNGSNLTRISKGELLQETGSKSSTFSGYEMVQNLDEHIDFDCLWNY